MGAFRLPDGGHIDRSRVVTFRFDGASYTGFAGDTLASALLANDVGIVGRSFKLHRPRGIVGAGPEEPNAIVEVGSGALLEPNLRATQVALYDGLRARTTKGWPSVRFDVGAINDLVSRALGAGFYYKTFMRPRRFWPRYEHLIRAAAGFGRSPVEPDPDRYEHRNEHCDVLVVGAGPAGLAAARAAAKAGARTIIADDQETPGGSLLAGAADIDGLSASDWLDRTLAELTELRRITLLPRATAFGYYDHNFVAIAERLRDHLGPKSSGPRQRLWRVRAREVVLAQGAFERPLVFCNNDRPGVMLASAVSAYIHRYAVCPGRRAIVFTNNNAAYQAALDLRQAGAEVTVVDSRTRADGELPARVRDAGIPVLHGHLVTDVIGTRRVRAARIAGWQQDREATVASTVTADCDLIAVSGGFNPAVHLHSQAGGRNRWDETLQGFVPGQSTQANQSAGACNGRFDLSGCLSEGTLAGSAAAGRCGYSSANVAAPRAAGGEDSLALEALWRVPSDKHPDRCPKQFVDFQNDVSAADIRQAVREGYESVEHVKRYTALGFGTDQGKLGNINGMAILAGCLGKSIPEVGTTTFRPAYTPVTFGTLAGEGVGKLYDPVRKTAIHDWHERRGVPMEVVGQWHRPWYFPLADEDIATAVARECLAVRNTVGIIDASTLGKIDARGPDVVTFLERIYTHNVGRMKPGRCAYGVMLGEDGMVMDDGVMARLTEDRYYLTTTTGGAAQVLGWLETWLQTEWPELEVYLTSLTDQYSTIAVAGPDSRRVLESMDCSVSLAKDDFPFMSVRSAELAGMPVQLYRVSFSGELAFEVNVDSHRALAMWEAIVSAGEPFGITPYGTETMHVLRAEKGFVIVGQDTDGSVSPLDLGMKWLLAGDKDYLGKRSLERSDLKRSDRKQLVGLLSADGESVVPEGAQLVDDPGAPKPVPILGHVTSSYRSAHLGHPIALALLAGGRARRGDTVYATHADREAQPVEVVSPVFYDPKGERQRV